MEQKQQLTIDQVLLLMLDGLDNTELESLYMDKVEVLRITPRSKEEYEQAIKNYQRYEDIAKAERKYR